MTKKSTNNTTNTNQEYELQPESGFERFMKNAFFTVWSIIGVILITLFAVAVFGGDTWTENLNITPTTADQSAEQAAPAQPPQQPPQPTDEQLACVEEELGEERLQELEQGAPAEEGEAEVIEQCLTE